MDSYSELMQANLSALGENNIDYLELIEQYHEKVKVSSQYLKKTQFIEDEIERIKNLFIKPFEATIEGDFKITWKFNYSEYVKYAYEWLCAGNDYKVGNIVSNAKQQYLQNKPVKVLFDESEFTKAIISNMRKGVAYLKYETFLKEELEKARNEISQNKKPRIQKAWVKVWTIIVGIAVVLGLLQALFDIFDRISPNGKQKDEIDSTKKSSSEIVMTGPYKTGILVAKFSDEADDPFSGPLVDALDKRLDTAEVKVQKSGEFFTTGSKPTNDTIKKIFKRNLSDKGLFVYGSIYYTKNLHCNIQFMNFPLDIKVKSINGKDIPIKLTDTIAFEVDKKALYFADYIAALFCQRRGDFICADSIAQNSFLKNSSNMTNEFRSEWCILLGNNYMALGKQEEAIKSYAVALDLWPAKHGKLETQYNLGIAYYLNKEYVSSKETLSKLGNKFEEASLILSDIALKLQDENIEQFGIIESDGKYAIRFIDSFTTALSIYRPTDFIWKGKRYFIARDSVDYYTIWVEEKQGLGGRWESFNEVKNYIRKFH